MVRCASTSLGLLVGIGAVAAAAVATSHSPVPHPYTSVVGRPLKPLPKLRRHVTASSGVGIRAAPWCAPGQACWPTSAQWTALNTSVGGNLIAVAPPLAPCFGTFPGVPYDGTVCNAAISNFSNSYWRASQPGASQEVVWEQGADGSDCYDAAKPCELGNIPPYAVRAAQASDVAHALAFARTHNIRVIIKSSGHEYQGRSAGADGLLIWLHEMKGVVVHDTYAACPGDAPQPAVTTAPGSSWGEVYAAADAAHVVVVGGSEISVSSCGGYSFGGGHSWTGPAYGMAADNALRFDVVLANGTAVTASACSNEDLFWALRGGGGGTFGVVTSCTYAAHPFPAAGAAGAFLTVELLQGNV